MQASPLAPVRDRFRCVAEVVVPEAAGLDEDGWTRLEAIVAGALADRPRAMVRQLQLFLRALDYLPLARFRRRFRSLDPEDRLTFLRSLERSRVALLRRGLWGLRTLVFMGYYGLEDVRAEIGYRATPDGWSGLEEADA